MLKIKAKSNSNLIVMVSTEELWGHAIIGTSFDTFTRGRAPCWKHDRLETVSLLRRPYGPLFA